MMVESTTSAKAARASLSRPKDQEDLLDVWRLRHAEHTVNGSLETGPVILPTAPDQPA